MKESVREILTNLGYKLTDYGTHYRCAALFRGGKNSRSLAIRKKDGRFIDFGGQNYRGSFKNLLELILGNRPEVIEKYINNVDTIEPDLTPKQVISKKKVYPKSILMGLLPHWDYFTKQGISTDTLKLFEVGLAQGGKLGKRYCFPIYNFQNEIVGFTGRWYQTDVPESTIKWKHIGTKTQWVWPLHLNKEEIIKARSVILVESPSCVLHLWEAGIKNAICLFGIDIGPNLLKFLLSVFEIDNIYIATNNEPDNRNIGNKAAQKIYKKLLQFFGEDKLIIALPPKKDFAVCSQEEILEWHKNLDSLTKIDEN